MSDYKLVSFEPTPEMVEAAEEAHMPFGDMDLALRVAILVAPVVQREPVAVMYEDGSLLSKDDCGDNFEIVCKVQTPLYAAAQPAEQQPIKSSLALEAATHLTNWLEMDICECEGGHYCGYNEVKRTRDALLEAAEQQPDVTQLVEALGCILSMDDKINIVDVMDPKAREMVEIARDALAAYRKGGEV